MVLVPNERTSDKKLLCNACKEYNSQGIQIYQNYEGSGLEDLSNGNEIIH